MAAHNFARLADSPLRDAWQDEARDFTPWLFDNIDYLSEALGLELEATDSEVAVDNFSADIMATDARTGDRILIENQLEGSDHRHLGQILTYLAGIDAKRVIWVAREFQEAHLSALRWLNDNTPEHFAFFAVRLRVVRIGDSPFAPDFGVVEKPNSWERQLGKRASVAESEVTRLRQSFWSRYVERHPGALVPTRDSKVAQRGHVRHAVAVQQQHLQARRARQRRDVLDPVAREVQALEARQARQRTHVRDRVR